MRAARSLRRLLAATCSLCWLAACGGTAAAEPGYDTPESALHDPDADVYLVSNIHGAPLAKDGNGYIARVQPDGGMERYWIQGGRDGVTLHAPKGMALHRGVLWVADIDVLRRFDRATGRPLGDVAIPGATFLNDIAAAPDGTIYCTDTGLDAKFEPTGTDAIWRIGADGVPAALLRGTDLGQPNGIAATDAGVYVVSWRDGAFFQVDRQGRRTDLAKAPTAQLDGLVRVPVDATADGRGRAAWLATSWAGECVYRFDTSGGCVPLPAKLAQPADAGYDQQRRRLLVPLFGSNRLELVAP
jgi:sugar lactone lactonase YvrE